MVIMNTPASLFHEIQKRSHHKPSPALNALIDKILEDFGAAVQGIIFYGSCLQSGNEFDGPVDLYVLVNGYRSAYKKPGLAALNWLLPPNVFYLELPFNGKIISAKYAVLSLRDFKKGTSMDWFHSYFWARFCQSTALIYARDGQSASEINKALAQSIITFLARVIPCINPEFTPRELWISGLKLSYGAEIRSEQQDRLNKLWDTASDYFYKITNLAINALPFEIKLISDQENIRYHAFIPERPRATCRITWKFRSLQGKFLSILRLLKATTTFKDSVDYAAWKIKRHSGVKVEVSPFLRRHPVLAMCILSWRTFRKGGIH